MAVGFITLMFLDGIFRVQHKYFTSVEGARAVLSSTKSSTMHMNHRFRFFSLVPLSSADVMSNFDFAVFTATWAVLLVPVPLSRIVTRDHTSTQVMVGTILGITEGFLWFLLVRRLQHKYNWLLGEPVCWGALRHDYPLPRFEVQHRCANYIAGRELDLLSEHESDEEDERIQRMIAEIGWYTRLTEHTMESRLEIGKREDAFMMREITRFNVLVKSLKSLG